MLIGIDASRANKRIKTGVEWYSYHLVQQFKEIDSVDQFLLYTREKLTGGLEKLPHNFAERVLLWPPRFLWTMLRLSWELFRRAPEVLFVPAHSLPVISPKNSVVTIHDIGFHRFPKLYKIPQIVYHEFTTRWALWRAKKIITVSEFTKQELVSAYHAKPEKIHVTYLGYDAATFTNTESHIPTASIRTKYGIGASYIIFVGRLEEKKNIGRTISAFERAREQSPELELVLVGAPGHGYTKLSQKGIHELGWISTEDIASLYRGAQALVFSSLYEGFGLPILEAQACGCPVITSNRCSMPEVGGTGAQYVDPENVQEISQAIHHILTDQSVRSRMIADGLENVKRFSWRSCAERTLDILKS